MYTILIATYPMPVTRVSSFMATLVSSALIYQLNKILLAFQWFSDFDNVCDKKFSSYSSGYSLSGKSVGFS